MRTRYVTLASRPTGSATLENFALQEMDVGQPAPGQALVRNHVMSLDPGMRPRMNDVASYAPPYQIGGLLEGMAVGEVIASGSRRVAVGDFVSHSGGWRELALVDADSTTLVDPEAAPLSAYLGVLGTAGHTAWVGIQEVAKVKAGETVWVSSAAGAVGQIAVQIASLCGARVVGSAGSPEKVRYLVEELGLSAAFDYHDGSVTDLLGGVAPEGVDVYFDNVGGDHLEAAIAHANVGARFAVCGAMSALNATVPVAAPTNLRLIIGKRLRIEGFLVYDHLASRGQFLSEIAPLVADGSMRYRESLTDGLENAPQAFLDLLAGKNDGKALVRL